MKVEIKITISYCTTQILQEVEWTIKDIAGIPDREEHDLDEMHRNMRV